MTRAGRPVAVLAIAVAAVSLLAIPAAAQSLALIVDDPDAPGGTWVHWVLYNLAPTLPGLDEKQPASATLPGIFNDMPVPSSGI